MQTIIPSNIFEAVLENCLENARKKIDLLFYTNGTMLGLRAKELARINRHMMFFVTRFGSSAARRRCHLTE